MGSPETEEGHRDWESPQHKVTLSPFYIGKYPVTQAQWKAVAALRPVNESLDPDPSEFKGANRPVEHVSWYDAVEFCSRLSRKTGREYRLPSEAEWEYACRAGTTTPFYLGETITSDLANYRGDYTYAATSKGIYGEQTTDVGTFPPNPFGLYDMHGNVWEWCTDHWHKNYQDAPLDGRAWNDNDDNYCWDDNDDQDRLMRGGCWYVISTSCRSACRYSYAPGDRHAFNIGFRVVCGGLRTS